MGSAPGSETERLSKLFVTLTEGFLTIPLNQSWTPYGKALRARQEIMDFIDDAIEHRRENPTNDALGLLIQTQDEDGNALTNEELQAQTLLLLFAGHENQCIYVDLSGDDVATASRCLAEITRRNRHR